MEKHELVIGLIGALRAAFRPGCSWQSRASEIMNKLAISYRFLFSVETSRGEDLDVISASAVSGFHTEIDRDLLRKRNWHVLENGGQ